MVYMQASADGSASAPKGLASTVASRYFEVDDLTERFKAKNGVARTEKGESNTYILSILSELDEWPEVIDIAEKLSLGEKLSEKDELWISELAEATGWDRSTIIDELMNISIDPSKRVEKYKQLYEEYFRDAEKLKEKGDTRQAGEKLWGAATALIKLYAAIKGVPILHWSRGRLERFITNNVEEKHQALFRDLLDKTQVFHDHFYEAHLDDKTFEKRWEEAVKLFKKARELTILGRYI